MLGGNRHEHIVVETAVEVSGESVDSGFGSQLPRKTSSLVEGIATFHEGLRVAEGEHFFFFSED